MKTAATVVITWQALLRKHFLHYNRDLASCSLLCQPPLYKQLHYCFYVRGQLTWCVWRRNITCHLALYNSAHCADEWAAAAPVPL